MERIWIAFALTTFVAGCHDAGEASAPVAATSLRLRAGRTAYTGAPPVIAHPPLSGSCTTCHTETGSIVPTLGAAPANPHLKTPGMSCQSRCRQCHIFSNSDDLFVENSFTGLRLNGQTVARAHQHAPPTIPHQHFMREDCLACHTGPAVRPETRCDHPERVRCQQCHVTRLETRTAQLVSQQQ